MSVVAIHSRPKVFLSFALTDAPFARQVAKILSASGAEVVGIHDALPGSEWGPMLRDAIRQSAAMVVAVGSTTSSEKLPASVLFEIGAAAGGEKPVFVILEDPSHRMRFSVPGMKILPVSRVEEIAPALSGEHGS